MKQAIGQRLRIAREALGLDQESVAVAIEKSYSAISKIESGKQNVPNSLITFFNSKGVSLEWLQNGEGDMMKANVAGRDALHNAGTITGGHIQGQGTQTNFARPSMDLNLVTCLEKEIEGLRALLAEKDERIQELKEWIKELKERGQ